ncbi:unnamed protein product [Cylindrotheca closterium]|uniref:Fe2OG dioxygenase domain-containing protein n=1 Tax=Cylindrotheca closterium TaxID=2856 RepID=A0AAD2JHA9_9STRA|nr:unnamed protein product [Cylindrotheca closterium]
MFEDPLGEIAVADSQFLGFCCHCATVAEVREYQQRLKKEYPNAAHIPVVYKTVDGSEGWDEDGEPPKSVGPPIMSVIQEQWSDSYVVVAVVRVWNEQLLGVTCGRLPQCYQSIARLALHRYGTERMNPLHRDIRQVDQSVYGLAAGDCELILDIVPDPYNTLLQQVQLELNFDGFKGAEGEVLPRLQNLQADLSQNVVPVYRYPGNYQGDEWETFQWSPVSLMIKKAVEDQLLLPQKMNHCVTNFYRDGKDFIAHHSDKDLDLNRQGVIVSVSLGDERIMELRRRAEPKDVTRIVLPPRSMLVLGPKTNKEFSHSILQKPDATQPRISLTMREVRTYLDLSSGLLYGQGASRKSFAQLRLRNLLDSAILVLGMGGAASKILSKTQDNSMSKTEGALWFGGLLAGSWGIKKLVHRWYKQQEENEAREFFSKSSMSGTKY